MIDKEKELFEYLKKLGRVAVAFSGGVDSTYLLYSAAAALGEENVLAVMTEAQCVPRHESAEAIKLARDSGVRLRVCRLDQLSIPGFAENPEDRCYICKHALFETMIGIAKEEGFGAMCDGTNLSDEGDFRPGMRALAELSVVSPLKECGFTKDDIRFYSRLHGLPTWDKASFACLASRFPTGERITDDKLLMVEKGEDLLRRTGFTQYRVRIIERGGDGAGRYAASIELLPEEFDLYRRHEKEITDFLTEAGFAEISLDPDGYCTGKMNEKTKTG
ncbi:MAG: ATP-dependent sacrificial sulfur transferase LarE [Anaerovoracaceae bacterium]|jgi:uncharacterized protein